MSQHTTTPDVTVGIDLGSRRSHICVLDKDGSVVKRGTIPTTTPQLQRLASSLPGARVVVEVGPVSPWVSRCLQQHGMDVIVANARNVHLIHGHHTKSDELDAERLARLGRLDPKLLSPIQHRSEQHQADLAVAKARHALVETRKRLVQHIKGTMRAFGAPVPTGAAESFHRKVDAVPEALAPALEPIFAHLEQLTESIWHLDRELAAIAEARYPQVALLQTVPGVGPVTAVTYVLTLEDPARFANSRAVGSYLGLRPRRDQSGAVDKALGITKAGDRRLRALLVQCAHHVLGPHGKDSALRQWGLRLAEGPRRNKRRAVVAVARKLAVILHRMWTTQTPWQPFPAAA